MVSEGYMAKSNPASSPGNSGGEAYEITSINDQMSVGANGRLVPVKVVYFRTMHGDTGHVEIPKDRFSADVAKAMIEAEVDQMLKLRGF